MSKKLYAGAKLREIRVSQKLSQRDFAQRLGVSLSYLNQMENNHRPLATSVVLGLVREFHIDVTTLAESGSARVVADLQEALADSVFDGEIPQADLELVAQNAPNFAHAVLSLHHSYRELQNRMASFNEVMDEGARSFAQSPWEEVRDFFHYCDNYIDPIDRAAEAFSKRIGLHDARKLDKLEAWLHERKISLAWTEDENVRKYSREDGVLTVSARLDTPSLLFQICHQIALIEYSQLIDATLDLARFRSEEAAQIARIGLANYFAGAVILPYQDFKAAAEATRHDLEELSLRFSASIEQIAHRLSTLQRPGQNGVPFFFVRVDQAGTITKRHSATTLQFARYGGACPLWNVHAAFASPGQFLRQLAETPDGQKYFCLAYDVSKPSGNFRAPRRRFAIGLGSAIEHANALVYADDLDIRNQSAFEPIGISCRICERRNCHQRAVPPITGQLKIDPNHRTTLPYDF